MKKNLPSNAVEVAWHDYEDSDGKSVYSYLYYIPDSKGFFYVNKDNMTFDDDLRVSDDNALRFYQKAFSTDSYYRESYNALINNDALSIMQPLIDAQDFAADTVRVGALHRPPDSGKAYIEKQDVFRSGLMDNLYYSFLYYDKKADGFIEVKDFSKKIISKEDAASYINNPRFELLSIKASEEIIDNLRHEVESERNNAGRKENTMPEQTQQNQNTQEKAKYANVKIPAAFLTQHEYTAKSGRTFEKAYVHFPEGTKVNGVDLSHYSCDVFMNDRMKQQMLSGQQVTVGFKTDEPVQVWTGRSGDPQNPYKKFEVKPWDLVKGIKAANEGFKAEKAAERETAKEQGVTLKGEYEQMRGSSAKLAGDNTPEEHATTR